MIGYTLKLTRKADEDEAGIYNYITDKLGKIYAEKFRMRFIQFLQFTYQTTFYRRPAKNDATLRLFIFNKQNKVVYKVEDDCITIIRILNTRTNLSSKF